MLASRKFRAVLLAVGLFGLLLLGHFVLVVTGKETVAELTEASKWAFGAMSGLISVFVAAIGYEDGQAKSVGKTVSAGGDVTFNQQVAPTQGDRTAPTMPPVLASPLYVSDPAERVTPRSPK